MPIDRKETLRKAEQLLQEGKIHLAIAQYRAVASSVPTPEGRYAIRDVAGRLEQLKAQTGGAAC